MQTFLPYADFDQSARVLDNKRLGKQRVEAYQILKALTEPTYGWKNHPAVKMWKGYEQALAKYGESMCREWISRGYNDTLLNRIFTPITSQVREVILPPWIGDQSFHEAHQSNLLRKSKDHYSKFNWSVGDDLPYIWPL